MHERLQKVNLALSHRSLTKLVHLIGQNHDATVKCWRDQLAEELKVKVVLVLVKCYMLLMSLYVLCVLGIT